MLRPLLLAALAASAVLPAFANEKLKGIACRSVHLGYKSEPDSTAFYNEVRVTDSAPGAYFMTTGWSGGYSGIQELADGRKVVIFSLWDSHTTDDPKELPEEKRTQVVYHAPDVRTGRFGGEGTGGQSFFSYDWKKGETYRFLVQVRTGDNGRAEYSGFFFVPETKTWKHLATFSSPFAPKRLKGVHSFVEDFRRNRESTRFTRRAEFGPAFSRNAKGEWKPVSRARFTGDGNPVMNIDAGPAENRFFLGTGGALENKTVPLWNEFENPAAAKAVMPEDAARAIAEFEANPDFAAPCCKPSPDKDTGKPAAK